MARPPWNTTVDPDRLARLTDDLVLDPGRILDWQITDPRTGTLDLTRASRWSEILRQARAEQIRRSPPAKEYVKVGASTTFAIAGFVIVAAPVGIPATIGLLAAMGGAGWTFFSAADLVRDDIVSMTRILAIDEADRRLADAIRRGAR